MEQMEQPGSVPGVDPWAQLRFSVVSGLLASPPPAGTLGEEIERLAQRRWRHPTRPGETVSFGRSTIERWLRIAREAKDPVRALRRKVRCDRGRRMAFRPALLHELEMQYAAHPGWSYKLHADNLIALVEERSELGPMPSYSTVRRMMQQRGWLKRKGRRKKGFPGEEKAARRLQRREVRGYEASHAHALWHSDFHHGCLRVVDDKGEWHTPKALCFLDDRSRLCCHIQWYLDETASSFIHGLTQALQKRGLPRALMTDNGSAMTAGETTSGLLRLGVKHDTTLPYSPYQNGKGEAFWGPLEGRAMAMLERVEALTLPLLNRATQAWVELEYNRTCHSELGMSPLDKMLEGPDASRPCPDGRELRRAFTVQELRTQRRSDGTIPIGGVRFEIPSRLRHEQKLHVRYQSWDLSVALVVDPRDDNVLASIYPQDKTKNARGMRRAIEPTSVEPPPAAADEPLPPLMRRLLAEYDAAGLPPAYIPKNAPEGEEGDDA